jgi:predicted homoserine dehydrogenase-like protein
LNLQSLLAARVDAEQAGPRRADRRRKIRLDVSGAGAVDRGLEVAVIADLDPERAKRPAGMSAGIPRASRARISPRGRDACHDERVDVVIEATGDPGAGIAHALEAIEARQAHRHGQCRSRRAGRPWLARKARAPA